MIDMPPDLDDAIALFAEKSAILDAAVKKVEEDQQLGRSGISAYSRAKMLRDELEAFGRLLEERITDALSKL
jgi:hypothetical protein